MNRIIDRNTVGAGHVSDCIAAIVRAHGALPQACIAASTGRVID